nr:helix-turn-helix domain-containing protein [Dechloromonas sp.]
MTTANKPAALFRPKDAANYLSVARSTLYKLVESGALPRPLKITEKASAWRKTDLDAFIERRMAMATGA